MLLYDIPSLPRNRAAIYPFLSHKYLVRIWETPSQIYPIAVQSVPALYSWSWSSLRWSWNNRTLKLKLLVLTKVDTAWVEWAVFTIYYFQYGRLRENIVNILWRVVVINRKYQFFDIQAWNKVLLKYSSTQVIML